MREYLVFGLCFLLILSIFNPMNSGSNITLYEESLYEFDRYLYPEYYDSQIINEKSDNFTPYIIYNIDEQNTSDVNIDSSKLLPEILDGPMDSPWPMHCHDTRHTGRSPYSTEDNSGYNKWWFKALRNHGMQGSPVIDNNGTIYTSGFELYAINPNGTMKWVKDIAGHGIWGAPAIDEEGVLYFGADVGNYFYAVYPNGTTKWKIGCDDVFSSPAIDYNGIVYFSDKNNHRLKAVYAENGTLKWGYKCNHLTYSSPAIGLDGTIYFGSIDNYIYAVNPNGTLKWKYKTGTWVHGSASIADDGTVYFGADNGLHAFHPNNGTLKWKLGIGGVWCTPVIDENGIIYVGVWESRFYAIYPDGTIKWTFYPGGPMWFGSSPTISADGTIYFGTTSRLYGTGNFFALNPDGTEKWRINTGWYDSSPAIGEDGTVYIGSTRDEEAYHGAFHPIGFLKAFNNIEPNAPSIPEIDGPSNVESRTEINYTFKSVSPLGNEIYYYIEWGDYDWEVDWWLGPYNSSEDAVISHKWSKPGDYMIRCRCKDSDNLWSDWKEKKVTVPRDRVKIDSCWLRFFRSIPYIHTFIVKIVFED